MSKPPPLEILLGAEFLERALSSGSDALRSAIRDCEALEHGLSYHRRILHGRLDILRAEIDRRERGGGGKLVYQLKGILAEQPRGSRGAHVSVPVDIPPPEDDELRALLSDAHLTRLPDLDDGELVDLLHKVTDVEARTSAQRRQLHGVIDALKGELVERYRQGSANPADVLGSLSDDLGA